MAQQFPCHTCKSRLGWVGTPVGCPFPSGKGCCEGICTAVHVHLINLPQIHGRVGDSESISSPTAPSPEIAQPCGTSKTPRGFLLPPEPHGGTSSNPSWAHQISPFRMRIWNQEIPVRSSFLVSKTNGGCRNVSGGRFFRGGRDVEEAGLQQEKRMVRPGKKRPVASRPLDFMIPRILLIKFPFLLRVGFCYLQQ